jgi:hypothetical protein
MMIWKVQAAIDVKEETQEKFRLGKKSATKHATNQKKKKKIHGQKTESNLDQGPWVQLHTLADWGILRRQTTCQRLRIPFLGSAQEEELAEAQQST